jgi:hypothetical protein
VAKAVCGALASGSAAAERRWDASFGVGVGLSGVQPESEALREGRAITAEGAVRRKLSGPARLGLRAEYLRIHTNWIQYCRPYRGWNCADRATPSRIHIVPVTPTLEADWRLHAKLGVYVGGGWGVAMIKRVPDRSDPRAHTQPGHTAWEASPALFAGLELGGSRARARLEVGWRGLGRVDVWSPIRPTRLTTTEAALHVSYGR